MQDAGSRRFGTIQEVLNGARMLPPADEVRQHLSETARDGLSQGAESALVRARRALSDAHTLQQHLREPRSEPRVASFSVRSRPAQDGAARAQHELRDTIESLEDSAASLRHLLHVVNGDQNRTRNRPQQQNVQSRGTEGLALISERREFDELWGLFQTVCSPRYRLLTRRSTKNELFFRMSVKFRAALKESRACNRAAAVLEAKQHRDICQFDPEVPCARCACQGCLQHALRLRNVRAARQVLQQTVDVINSILNELRPIQVQRTGPLRRRVVVVHDYAQFERGR